MPNAVVSIACSDVQGGQAGIDNTDGVLNWGAGNFDLDPLFCNAAGGNYTLQADSPCLPGQHPDNVDCGLIGAWGAGGCGSVFVDCNDNGIADSLDIADHTSADCNVNQVPDECDLTGGFSVDCNLNLIPDECDISASFSLDCQPDGVPDECQAGEPVFQPAGVAAGLAQSTDVEKADLDGDGDLDLLSNVIGSQQVWWHENNGASPPSFLPRLITSAIAQPNDMAVADLDGDGDLDLGLGTSSIQSLWWLENDGALPPQFGTHLIAENLGVVAEVAAADLDGDGDLDLAGAGAQSDRVYWFANDGGADPIFATRLIDAATNNPYSMTAADLDRDGDLDLATAAYAEGHVVWFQNDGGAAPTFTKRVVATALTRPCASQAADMNGDGFVDLLTNADAGNLCYWLENDRQPTPSFTVHAIPGTLSHPYRLQAADLDGDGFRDLLATGFFDDRIVWYHHDGQPVPAFDERVLATGADGAFDVLAADLDRDGDLDVVYSEYSGNRIAWLLQTDLDGDSNGLPDACDLAAHPERDCDGNGILDSCDLNTGAAPDCNGNGVPDSCDLAGGQGTDCQPDGVPDACQDMATTFARIPLATGQTRALDVDALDLDRDGDLDLLTVAADIDLLAWHESDGALPPHFTSHAICSTIDDPYDAVAMDLDGDDDLDVALVTRASQQLWWFESDGTPPAFTAHQIAGGLGMMFEVTTTDLDGDGDLDLATSSYESDAVYWFENDGAADPVFGRHDIDNATDGPFSVTAADLDHDGDQDLISAAYEANRVVWFRNDGLASPTLTKQVIDIPISLPRATAIADLNSDGFIDILTTSTNDHQVYWLENDQQTNPGFISHAVPGSLQVPYRLHAADVDGDGFQDIIAAGYGNDRFVWYHHDGQESPGFSEQLISTCADGAFDVEAADLDHDGDLDLITSEHFGNQFAWYRQVDPDCNGNLFPDVCDLAAAGLDCNGNGILDACDLNTGAAPDCNGNGVPDACDIAAGVAQDCDGNQIPDACDIAAGVAPDCNGNGVPDACDIAAGMAQDCNGNQIPDLCDLATGFSLDCQPDQIPDECQLADSTHADCNGNGIPDDCDIALGTSLDCQPNQIPDECESGGEEFLEHVISDTATNCIDIFPADLDDDGDLDLIVGSNTSSGLWFEYMETPTPTFVEHTFATAYTSNSVCASDIDKDGYIDIIAASYVNNRLDWYESNGTDEPQYQQHLIANMSYPWSIFSADLNGDGYQDVLAAAANTGGIKWYKNNGETSPSFSEYLVSSDQDDVFDVKSIDLDRDNDIDFITSHIDGGLYWWENSGGENPIFESHLINAQIFAFSSSVCDIDRDGDFDIVVATNSDVSVWLENSGHTVPNFTPVSIPGTSYSMDVFAKDINGDGMVDIIFGGSNRIDWYENDGSGQPSFIEHQVSTGNYAAYCVIPVDVEEDGDLDILATLFGVNKLAWYEQRGNLDCNGNNIPDECDLREHPEVDCNANGILDYCDINTGAEQDVNGNGMPDVCEVLNLDHPASYTTITAALAEAHDLDRLQAPPLRFQLEPVLDFGDKAVRLQVTGDARQAAVGSLMLADGASLRAAGELDFLGQVRTGLGDETILAGLRLEVGVNGRLWGAAGAVLDVQVNGAVACQGELRLDLMALMGVGDSLSLAGVSTLSEAGLVAGHIDNSGSLTLLGSQLLADQVRNSATCSGWGEILADLDNPGELLVQSDLIVTGDLANEGQITIQHGSLTVFGDLSGNGTIDGLPVALALAGGSKTPSGKVEPAATPEPGGLSANPGLTEAERDQARERRQRLFSTRDPQGWLGDLAEHASAGALSEANERDEGDAGLVVLGSLHMGAAGSLQLPQSGARLKVGGDLDLAIDDPARFDLGQATLQLAGTGGAPQLVELMSRDLGQGLPGAFPLGELVIGPTHTTVLFVDQHDNDGQGQDILEGLYLTRLEVMEGCSLITAGAQVYATEVVLNGHVDEPGNLHQLALDAPANLRLTLMTPTHYLLEWEAVEGADHYQIYARPAVGTFELFGETATTEFLLSPPTTNPGSSWSFRVTARSEPAGATGGSAPSVGKGARPAVDASR